MSYEKAREYALVKFAVLDYLIQGKPIAFLAEEAYRKGFGMGCSPSQGQIPQKLTAQRARHLRRI